jgi:hypothetical protein
MPPPQSWSYPEKQKKKKMTKREKDKLIKTFYLAAELLEERHQHFCCPALSGHYSRSLFEDLFKYDALDMGHDIIAWFQAPREGHHGEARERRILGLCLAAELIRTGDIFEVIFERNFYK